MKICIDKFVQIHIFTVLADLNELKWEAESFSLITVNPPYFVSGAGKENVLYLLRGKNQTPGSGNPEKLR